MRARLSLLALLLTTLVAVPVGLFSADETTELAPTKRDGKIAREVCAMLNSLHLLPMTVDDTVAQRAFDEYLDRLDPQKLYFLKSDIEEFRPNVTKIDDQVKAGDLSFGFTVFDRFLQRVDERMAQIDEHLAGSHDFTADEVIVLDRDDAGWADTGAELDEAWRKRIKYFMLEKLATGETPADAIDQLEKRYRNFKRRMHQTDNDELLEMYLSSVTSAFDPHTTYMSPSTLENFQINMRLELEGIGAALRSVDGYTVVSEIITGGAAHRDGQLEPEDKIIAVAQGDDDEWNDVVDLKLNDVVKQIRGKKGTIVRLRIKRTGKEPFVVKLTRAKVELKDSEAIGEVFEHGKKPDGTPYRVGVIDLPSFYMDMGASRNRDDFKSTTRDVLNIVHRFQLDGIDGIVLDLRANGGGALQEALDLTGLFIDRGPLVQIKDAGGRVEALNDRIPAVAYKGPLVVLTSRFSASASEIFAGAIQDYKRGLIVGDTNTHGKGTVQTLEDVGRRVGGFLSSPKMGALKITKQQFYRPDGDSTQTRGILADIVLPSVANHGDLGEGKAPFAVPFDSVPSAKHTVEEWVSPSVVARVDERTKKRRAADAEWAKVDQRIQRYLKYKDRIAAPLNRDKFIAEWNDMQEDGDDLIVSIDAEAEGPWDWSFVGKKKDEGGSESKKDEESDESKEDGDDGPKIKRDYYLDEALAITVDFIELQTMPKLAN